MTVDFVVRHRDGADVVVCWVEVLRLIARGLVALRDEPWCGLLNL